MHLEEINRLCQSAVDETQQVPMPFTAQDAQTTFDAGFAPWVRALDLTFSDPQPDGRITTVMPITPELTRMGDILSGQALATLADTAMVFACAALFGELRPVATTNLEVQFLRPGQGSRVICSAEVVKPGRSLLFCRAVMRAEPSGKEIATATGTFFLA